MATSGTTVVYINYLVHVCVHVILHDMACLYSSDYYYVCTLCVYIIVYMNNIMSMRVSHVGIINLYAGVYRLFFIG